MGQPHLVDTLALPAVPGFLGILGGRLRVPLDDGDQVAVAGEHHPQTEAHHPATDHHDLGHTHTPRCSCSRCVYSTVTLLARLRGWSMSTSRRSAAWYASSWSGTFKTIGSISGCSLGTRMASSVRSCSADECP